MHEFFLTAVVDGDDSQKARSVLHGASGMTEQHTFTRVVYFNSTSNGLPMLKSLQKDRADAKFWNELHTILKKQAYTVQARYSVNEGALKGGAEPVSLAGRAGLLRFADVPDSLGNRAAVHTQRKVMELRVNDLERILTDNKFVVKSQCIEEGYTWWMDGNQFELNFNRLVEPAQLASGNLPSLADIVSPAPWWFLYVRTLVPDVTPDTAGQAVARLMVSRDYFQGVFDFRAFDKLLFDSRYSPSTST